jgi:hypothetical protein
MSKTVRLITTEELEELMSYLGKQQFRDAEPLIWTLRRVAGRMPPPASEAIANKLQDEAGQRKAPPKKGPVASGGAE